MRICLFVPQVSFGPNPGGAQEYWADIDENSHVQINFTETKMIISYSGQGVAFDNIVINNINTQPVPGGNAAELTGGTLQELAETLPDTAWTISFESSTTPEKNFNHVVTVEWVAKIKAWMISQS